MNRRRTLPTTIGLKAGQEMRVKDLLVAALLSSANDATVVLAERIAGSEELFAHLMNKKAFVLGAVSTTFKNSNGLPAEGHLSTCHDLFIISRAALQKPFLPRRWPRPKNTLITLDTHRENWSKTLTVSWQPIRV